MAFFCERKEKNIFIYFLVVIFFLTNKQRQRLPSLRVEFLRIFGAIFA
jgi:hypothetical protein